MTSSDLNAFSTGHFSRSTEYQLVGWLFLRALALVYFVAFISFGQQAQGLIGSKGLLPLESFLSGAFSDLGSEAYWRLPNVFWLSASDNALSIVCWLGATLAGMLFLNIAPVLSLIGLFVLYLSLFYAGQIFMGFQWDLLLLEAGFLAIFLPGTPLIAIWLYRWLLFRFMFFAGLVKLLGNDSNWANFSALSYHFETQPLPSPLAWYAHQLPSWVHTASVATTLVIELILPFFIFLPRSMRFLAAWSFLLLETLILLTGNFNFFNILTMLLCLFLFDDRALWKLVPAALLNKVPLAQPIERRYSKLLIALTGIIVFISGLQAWTQFSGQSPPRLLASTLRHIEPLRIVNPYGLFAVMTTSRPEIVIEGSNDQKVWKEYDFKYKPGDPTKSLSWNIPHQPRLDWQMWFAAIGQGATKDYWVGNLLIRLLEGSPVVLHLLNKNPFVDQPPKFVRALLYDYKFTNVITRQETGAWWTRTPTGVYFPTITIQNQLADDDKPIPGSLNEMDTHFHEASFQK